ncbi:hypothetical protein [Sandaracinus amylolyticus]|uniref:Uncharacterized protein n=1 Tax=Sandaracinus amylolyticus TaxID=927083 RepID=A0A0F6W4Z3_9BACT|nr:hypothetical protein [Sandaracinus amylolyticus]AKF07408.1 hypothetical protein DB32_004557 [Sandaracinus amylolyticus]
MRRSRRKGLGRSQIRALFATLRDVRFERELARPAAADTLRTALLTAPRTLFALVRVVAVAARFVVARLRVLVVARFAVPVAARLAVPVAARLVAPARFAVLVGARFVAAVPRFAVFFEALIVRAARRAEPRC